MLDEEGERGDGAAFLGVCVCDEEGFWEGEFAAFEGGDGDVGLVGGGGWEGDGRHVMRGVRYGGKMDVSGWIGNLRCRWKENWFRNACLLFGERIGER